MENQKIPINKVKIKKPKERVAIFVDGSNFYYGLRRLKIKDVKFEQLFKEILSKRKLAIIFFYTVMLDPEYSKKQFEEHNKFLEKIKGIRKMKIVLCTLKRIRDSNGKFHFEVKGDDIHLAKDMLVGAYEDLYDTAILISGDEDFVPITNTIIDRLGKKIENIFFRRSSSRNLRESCSTSLNINNILKKIKSPGQDR